jgi:uncharacterized 2Fe-2S/4Fe-4S cluster protein (DUF4445 family)
MVELLHGTLEDIHSNDRMDSAQMSVRACAYRAASDVLIRVPQRALLSSDARVLDDFAIRVTAARDPLVDAKWGVAIDVGTTTIALLLVDLGSGEIVSRASAFNAQMQLGDDVITRITLCMSDAEMLQRIQAAVVDQTIRPLLDQALGMVGGKEKDVGIIVVAGNTTMLHLLAGVDPTPLGIAPFTPRFTEYRILQLPGLPAPLHLLPSATAYIGADIVAGLIATGTAYEATTTMLVDVGTNGEIVLHHGDHLVACATAAGPAFEGARLASGMRAGRGAITDVRLNLTGSVGHELRWIGQGEDGTPLGLCGSAYIDFLAEARRTELLSPTGRFDRSRGNPDDWHRNGDNMIGYRLTTGEGGRPIIVSECDIAALLAAKAAIAAGIHLLLDQPHLRPRDVRQVFLAGGFGTHMNAANAIAIGLLPGFSVDQIVPVGNSALAGAFLALTDRSLLADMQRIATQIQSIELNLIPSFQDVYIDMLSLP